jgi:HEAT repeat protein
MDVTMDLVRSLLAPDEPDYGKAKKVGPAALPFLAELVASDDKMTASKAASLAGMIGGPEAAPVLERAAKHPEVAVRAAAAHGAPGLPRDAAEHLLLGLIDDAQPAVSHRAVVTAGRVGTDALRRKLEAVRSSHPAEFVREAAEKSL